MHRTSAHAWTQTTFAQGTSPAIVGARLIEPAGVVLIGTLELLAARAAHELILGVIFEPVNGNGLVVLGQWFGRNDGFDAGLFQTLEDMPVGIAAIGRDPLWFYTRGRLDAIKLSAKVVTFVDVAGRDRHIDHDALPIIHRRMLFVAGSGRFLATVGGKEGLRIRRTHLPGRSLIFLPHLLAMPVRIAGIAHLGSDQGGVDMDRLAADQARLKTLLHGALENAFKDGFSPALPNAGEAAVIRQSLSSSR
jgi:hypothetical protein